MKDFWKKVLLLNSILWCFGAVYFVYVSTYAALSFDWHRFVVALLIIAFLSITEVVFALLGEPS